MAVHQLFTIQPDRTGEDLQGGMAEDPQKSRCEKLVASFPKRLMAVLNQKGASTKY